MECALKSCLPCCVEIRYNVILLGYNFIHV